MASEEIDLHRLLGPGLDRAVGVLHVAAVWETPGPPAAAQREYLRRARADGWQPLPPFGEHTAALQACARGPAQLVFSAQAGPGNTSRLTVLHRNTE